MAGVAPVGRARGAPMRAGRGLLPRGRFVPALLLVVALVAALGFVLATRSGRSTVQPVGDWRVLPRAPLAGRIAEASVWTGRELVVAGGVVRPSTRRARDGAAYDPASRTWRTIAAPPSGVGAGAVWTGRRLVVWTGNGPDGPTVAAAYDPQTDAWQRLPAGPLGPREGNANVWTGSELLVIGGYSGDGFAAPIAAALDPATGRWRRLTGLYGLTLAGGPNGAVWDGREAIIAGKLSLCPEQGTACGRRRPILVAYDPTTDRMRELKLPAGSASFGADTAASLTPVAWTGSAVVIRAWTAGSLRVLRYLPATQQWQIGPQAPCVLEHGTDTQTAWIGDRLVAPCAADGLQIYDPVQRSWQWRSLTPGASPLNARLGSAIAWTGKQLIVWSGVAFQRFNPTPADGAALAFGR